MRATVMGCAVIMAILCMWAAHGAAQEEMRFVDNSVFAKVTRPAAVFEHDIHNEASGIDDCAVCHHVYEDGRKMEDESSEDMSCSECHDGSEDGPALTLRKAFHQSCKGCHLERKDGPILCGECHQR